MGNRAKALMRAIPDSFSAALGQVAGERIDVERARAQHATYAEALGRLGVAVTMLPADEALPDCCFVEDAAVVFGDEVLLTRPGAPSRRGEVAGVADALGADHRLLEPACVDGGDVLVLGERVLVGLSERTNAAGAAAVRAAWEPRGAEVIAVPVGDAALHLKCHMTSPRPGLVVSAPNHPGLNHVPAGWTVLEVPPFEAYAANVVGVGDAVMVAEGYPVVVRLLTAEGATVVTVDVSEIAKAAGSLTCLSVMQSVPRGR